MYYQDEEGYRRWRQHGEERGWLERARDQVQSWFGDEDAEHRRDLDRRREGMKAQDYGVEGARQFQRDSVSGQQADQVRRTHYGKGPRNYQRSDERIREDIADRLARNWDIDATDLEVEVNKGDVILRGMVESRPERRLAEEVAEEVFGVKNVQNLIKVRQMIGIDTPASSSPQPRTTGGVTGGNAGGNNR